MDDVYINGLKYVPAATTASKFEAGNKCPNCGAVDSSEVYDTRFLENISCKMRRRRCLVCFTKWKTIEVLSRN